MCEHVAACVFLLHPENLQFLSFDSTTHLWGESKKLLNSQNLNIVVVVVQYCLAIVACLPDFCLYFFKGVSLHLVGNLPTTNCQPGSQSSVIQQHARTKQLPKKNMFPGSSTTSEWNTIMSLVVDFFLDSGRPRSGECVPVALGQPQHNRQTLWPLD